MGRRLRLAVVGAAIAAAAVGGTLWALVPSTRFVYGLAPVAVDEAVLLTRRNEDRATHYWAQLVDSDGAVAWSTELSPHQVHEALGFSAIAASTDRVVLLADADDTPVVIGLDRATGDRLWQTALVRAGDSGLIGDVLMLDGPRVYAQQRRTPGFDGPALTALALVDGAVLWTLDDATVPGDASRVRVAVLGPDRLAVTGTRTNTGVELDGATGRVDRPLPLRHLGCDTPRGVIGFDDTKVVVLPRVASAPAEIAETGADPRPSLDGPCGVRGDDVVIGTHAGDGAIGLLRIDPAAGAIRWRLDLGAGGFIGGDSQDGSLPRFVPITAYAPRADDSGTNRTIVIDLDLGVIVSDHLHDDHRSAFVTGERAYVLSEFTPALFALDPATGALASATHLGGVTTDEIRRQDLRFGTLWLGGMGWGRPDALSWAAIDLGTATAVHQSGAVALSDLGTAGWAEAR